MHMHLDHLGWTPFFQQHFQRLKHPGLTPARIMGVHKSSFTAATATGEIEVSLAGRLRHHASDNSQLPAAGDWVLLRENQIIEMMPRQNCLSRGESGYRHKMSPTAASQQIIAANIDTVFIVCGLDRDFNLRRIERYLTLIYNCGLTPVIILTKKDLHTDVTEYETQVSQIAIGVPVHAVSAKFGQALEPLKQYISSGKTITLIGSSGAGKSTLVNQLAGRTIRATAQISDRVGKGVHCTTSRDLILLPTGGLLLDTPGLREIAFWEDEGKIDTVFGDIADLAAACRFSNCSHRHEPGCRVRAALETGELSQKRFDNYCKMQQELWFLSQRETKSADRIEKERWKQIALKIRKLPKYK